MSAREESWVRIRSSGLWKKPLEEEERDVAVPDAREASNRERKV